MSLIKCKQCGHMVHKMAPMCPECGAPRTVTRLRLSLITLAAVSVIGVAGWHLYRVVKLQPPAVEAPTTEAAVIEITRKEEPDFKLSCNNLFKEYFDSKRPDFEQKYGGRTIRVTGTVAHVVSSFVDLWASDGGFFIRCYFTPADAFPASKLQPREKTTITGVYLGGGSVDDALPLKNCIVSPEK